MQFGVRYFTETRKISQEVHETRFRTISPKKIFNWALINLWNFSLYFQISEYGKQDVTSSYRLPLAIEELPGRYQLSSVLKPQGQCDRVSSKTNQ